MFLTGEQWGEWNDALLITLLKGQKLLVLDLDETGKIEDAGLAITDRGRLRSAVQGPDAALYISTDNGGGGTDVILKITPG